MRDRHGRIAAALLAAGALLAGCADSGVRAGPPPSALAVRGSTATVEIAPVLLAARDHVRPAIGVRNGGIGNLVGAARGGAEWEGDGGPADVATHAETQALRYSVDHPDLRIILTVTEGRYRIIARRSAGIARVDDLKGKRVATLATTSAGYFLARMLEEAGLAFADVTAVRMPPEAMADALARGDVDAVAIWEPHAGSAAHAIGDDAIAFAGDGVYRELFNLNTTAARLADPEVRREIVAFVRAVMAAAETMRRDPQPAQALVAETAGFSPEDVARAWPTLSFPAALPPDLLDVLVTQEQWLAAQAGRAPRPREALARLIDSSIYEEARGR